MASVEVTPELPVAGKPEEITLKLSRLEFEYIAALVKGTEPPILHTRTVMDLWVTLAKNAKRQFRYNSPTMTRPEFVA